MVTPHRHPLAALVVGLLAVVVGSLHGTGALLGSSEPSSYLLASGVAGLVLVFAACANLQVERARRTTALLFGASVVVYVPWLVYAMITSAKPLPANTIGATLTGLLAAAVAATAAAGAVLLCHRVELVLGWHDPPEKRLLSEEEYASFVDGAKSTGTRG